jgi:hypothetical protein
MSLESSLFILFLIKNACKNFSFLKVLATNRNINKKADHTQLRNWQFLQSLQILNEIYSLILVTGMSILVYILIDNQQMHQNDHFIMMSNQTLLHVSAY